jgi:hypothetical protein
VPEAGKMCIVLMVPKDVGSGDDPPGNDTKGLLTVKFAD